LDAITFTIRYFWIVKVRESDGVTFFRTISMSCGSSGGEVIMGVFLFAQSAIFRRLMGSGVNQAADHGTNVEAFFPFEAIPPPKNLLGKGGWMARVDACDGEA
jgi:hypothetical protein